MEKREKIKKIVIFTSILLFVFVLGIIVPYFNSASNTQRSVMSSYCNTANIALNGQLVTYAQPNNNSDQVFTSSDEVMSRISNAENDPTIKAIVVQIDSYGGGSVAGEEISNALKNSNKPTVALIRSAGASAAYWAATGAKTIFASEKIVTSMLGTQ